MHTRLRLFLVLVALSITTASNTFAAPKDASAPREFGAGIVLGEPTGLSAKLWFDRDTAADFGLAFSLSDYFLIFSDYLFHFRGTFGNSHPFFTELATYVGIGGVLAFADHHHHHDGRDHKFYGHDDSRLGIGVRVPVGVEWLPPKYRLGVFLEIVPGLAIIPGTDVFIDAGIGARYYF